MISYLNAILEISLVFSSILSRQLRRLDSVTRSWIFANFGETIQGLSSFELIMLNNVFIDVSDKFVDRNQSCHLASSVSNRLNDILLNQFNFSRFHFRLDG